MARSAENLAIDRHYIGWLGEVRSHFPVAEEYDLAAAIYSFSEAYLDGMSPQEAYDAFDAWVAA